MQKKSSSIREFAARPGVLLVDEHAFDSLERPELFKDAFHLNNAGCSPIVRDAWHRRSPGCSGDAPCCLTPPNSSSSWPSCWRCSMPRRGAWRKYILLAASYYFYASWNAKFIALLLTLTAIDYTSGLWLERVPPGPRRKAVADLQPGRQSRLSGLFQVLQFPGQQPGAGAGAPANARSSSISCCRWASAFTPSRACPTWWTSIAASSAPCAIRWTTRSSSASSRNWWPARSCGRAISSATAGPGSRPRPTTSRAASS